LLTIGLMQQGVISKRPLFAFVSAFVAAPVVGALANFAFDYHGNLASLILLGLVALAQAWMGVEWIQNEGQPHRNYKSAGAVYVDADEAAA